MVLVVIYNKEESTEGHRQAILALENLSVQNREGSSAYDFWFKDMIATLRNRGKMGSLVGASQEFRKNAGMDSSLNDYAVCKLYALWGITTLMTLLSSRICTS
jgi:cytokinesis protein